MGAGIGDGDVRTDDHGPSGVLGKSGNGAGSNLGVRIRRYEQKAEECITDGVVEKAPYICLSRKFTLG